MKKYVKPDFLYENFELSQSVAVCSFDMSNSADVNTCTATADPEMTGWDGIAVFTNSNENCISLDQDTLDQFCLTVSSDSFSVFNS